MNSLIAKLKSKGVFEESQANETAAPVELKGAILAMISGGDGGSDQTQGQSQYNGESQKTSGSGLRGSGGSPGDGSQTRGGH